MFDEESMIYTTIQGDTWDMIAYKVFGDEKYASDIMNANYDYIDILVFDNGELIDIPKIDIEEVQGLPSWLEEDGEDDADNDPFAEYEDDEDAEYDDDWISDGEDD